MKPYLPQTYLADTGDVRVEAVVHIESGSWHARRHADWVDETRWVAGLPFAERGAPRLGAIVACADPRRPDIADVLDQHLAVSPLVHGVRWMGAHHDDPGVRSFADGPHVLSSPAFLRGFAAIADRQMTFEIWIYAHQLPDAVTLASEYPQSTFVLDHYATPVGIFGPRGKQTGRSARDRDEILRRWRDDIAALAALPNVVAKHSGIGMPLLGFTPRRPVDVGNHQQLAELAAPLITATEQLFGASRTMWASNFAIDKPTLTIPASIAVLDDALGDSADPEQLYRKTADRVYRLNPLP